MDSVVAGIVEMRITGYLMTGMNFPIAQKRIMEFREKLNDFLQGNA